MKQKSKLPGQKILVGKNKDHAINFSVSQGDENGEEFLKTVLSRTSEYNLITVLCLFLFITV